MAKTTIWTGAVDGDFTDAGNWSNGVPVSTDTVVFRDNAVDLDTALDQSAITLAALVIEQSYTGRIGTAAAYFQIGATTVTIGEHYGYGSPVGSGRIKIDLSTAVTTVTVHNSASTSTDTNLPAVQLLVDTVGSVESAVRVLKGYVGIACTSPAETSELNLEIAYKTSKTGDANVVTGVGATVLTVDQRGGVCFCRKTPAAIDVTDGTLTVEGTGTITTLAVRGGTVYLNNSGGVTTAAYYGGVSDYTKSLVSRTVGSSSIYAGATVKYDPSLVTHTGGITAQEPVSLATSTP